MSISLAWSQAFRKQETLVRGLINFAIGVAAFAFTCIGLHAVLPSPNIDEVSDKLRFFAQHKDEFDTLFLGSSRTYHEVSPPIFDQVMRDNGTPTRSFNFGIDGMHMPESNYVLERIFEIKPANLKWVVIEFDEVQTNWLFQDEGSRRAVYWHDWKRTSIILRKMLDAGTGFIWFPSPKKLLYIITHRTPRRLVAFHASQFQKDFTNLGRASDIWDYFCCRDKAPDLKWLGLDADGYRPFKTKMSPAQVGDYEEILTRAQKKTGPEPISVYTDKSGRECAEKIRELGAIPVFVVDPILTSQSEMTFRSDPPGVVISFNDARAYPNLYRTDMRLDRNHLNKTGAEEYSRLMALKFVELLNAGKIQ